MSDDTHPYDAIITEIDAQTMLSLIRSLIEELSSELQVHLDDDRLRGMRDDDSVQLLLESARFLRKKNVDLPPAFLNLLLIVSEVSDQE